MEAVCNTKYIFAIISEVKIFKPKKQIFLEQKILRYTNLIEDRQKPIHY